MTHSLTDLSTNSFHDVADNLNSRLGRSEILRMMRRHLAMNLLVMITGLTATALWLAHQVPVYSATAAILLRSSELPSETADSAPSPGVVTSTQVFTEAEVLRSRDFAWRLADRLNLISDPRFNPAMVEPQPPTWFDRILDRLGLSEPEADRDMPPDRQRAEVLAKLLNLYSVAASEKHNVIDIRAEHSDPILAARIANETARLFIDLHANEQVSDLERDIRFMRERSREISSNLSHQQTRMTSLMLENQLLDDSAVRTLVAERSRLRTRMEAAQADAPDRDALDERIQSIDAELAQRVSAEIRLAEYQTALHTETERLDAINKRLDELEAQRQSPIQDVRQISVAEVPSTPSGPNVPSTLAISFVVFGFLGFLVALMRENMDDRVLHQDQIERLTGLHVVASLTRLPKASLRRHLAPHLCVASDASPGYSNAVRALVSAAMEGAELGRAPIIFIGSAKSGEGKSSIASSMAVAAAMDDLRVLLIDLDVHRFGLTRNFGVKRGQVTFGEVLSSRGAFSAAVKKTGHEGIELLNLRPASKLSRIVLRSESAQDVIGAMREAYDLVIIDTPPFLAAEEAGRLHGMVDKAILVSRWGEASRDTLAQTVHMMRRSGLAVIGIAMNAISPRSAHSYGFLAFCDDYYRSKRPSDA